MQGLDLRQPYTRIVLCARKSQGLNIVFFARKIVGFIALVENSTVVSHMTVQKEKKGLFVFFMQW